MPQIPSNPLPNSPVKQCGKKQENRAREQIDNLNQKCHRHNISSDELAFPRDNSRKPLTSCTENSGTTAPVKQYHSAPLHQLIFLMGNVPGEQGGCLKDCRCGQRKACELTQKCHLAMQEDKSDKDVLSRIMLKTVCSLVLSGCH